MNTKCSNPNCSYLVKSSPDTSSDYCSDFCCHTDSGDYDLD